MPVVKFDVSGTDPDAAKSYEQPKPGVYRAKVHEVTLGYSKGENGKPDKSRPRLEVIYEITDKKYKGARLWEYISFGETSQWKMDQFLQAFGIATKKKRTGSFKTEAIVGEACKLRIKAGKNLEGEYRGEVGAVLPMADEEDDEDEDFEDEEPEDMEDDEEDEEEDEEEDDEDAADEEDEDEDEEEPEARHYDMDELSGMALAGLKDVASDLELEPPSTVLKNKTKLATWIFENQPVEAGDDEDEEEDSDEEEDGYDELSLAELKEECKERGLKPVGSKDALIAKLRKADAEGPF